MDTEKILSYSYYLFDFAEVISLKQDMDCIRQIQRLLQIGEEELEKPYWKYRKTYDLGQAGEDYWRLVAGRDLSEDTVRKIIDFDCKSWRRINPVTIDFLVKLQQEKKKLGLLSNLPIELVQYLRKNFTFLGFFDHVFFSSEIHLTKPDQAVYEYVLQKIGVSPSEILFFDDKEENLKPAEKIGINTYLFKQENIGPTFLR